uniref:Rne/Rng family ribonuclease n=1 Tax=Crenalkalicoccus roseus TaxID=1485588 RepID=UPI003083F352
MARERRIPPKFLRHYKIQEVIKRRQIMLVQVVKEERGTKGAALTTYISLAGRFSVLMPNSPRAGGISRKITSAADRKRLREIVDELGLPEGMSLIIRTAGAQRPKAEIKRDCEYLLRLWDNIRERTLQSTAPALIYEEADLIKRAIRDVFSRDVEEILVEGEEAYQQAREFMRMLMPQHVKKIQLAREGGLFARHQVEAHLDAMHSPTVPLKSGGYIVINQTEALVAIDVNSGRATRDRHIEDTALRTNLEAADEIARQLRLRDLAGLIVIDFIDMESGKHDAMVERRLKEALKQDRARIQVGRISHFGLLEMSRQRLRPSLAETTFVTCPHCQGRGQVRSVESSALQVLRAIEDEGAKRRAAEITVHVAAPVALYLLNRKRDRLAQIEARYRMSVLFEPDESLVGANLRIERTRAAEPGRPAPEAPAALRMDYAPEPEPTPEEEAPAAEEGEEEEEEATARGEAEEARPGEAGGKRRRRRRRRRGGRGEEAPVGAEARPEEAEGEGEEAGPEEAPAAGEAPEVEPTPAAAEAEGGPRRRRRRRRGPRPEGAPEEAATVPPRYSGPTPADPFAGHVDDIFAAMEAAEAALEAAARPPAGGAAPAEAEAPAAWQDGAAAEPAPFQAEAPPLPEEAPAAEPAFVPPPEPAPPPTAAIPAAEAAPEPSAEAPERVPAQAEGEAEDAAAQPATPVQGPLVMPKVIGQVPIEAPRRTGWWRR